MSSKRPNILFIAFDDLTDSIHGLGGHPQAKTPHLDALSKRGVRFINGHCNSPLCAPSRASFLSGLLPSTTGYYCRNPGDGNPWEVNPTLKNCKTIMEHLRDDAGYKIYGGGKLYHNGHERDSVWENADGENGYGSPKSWGPYPWDGKSETKTYGWNNVAHPNRRYITTDGVWAPLSELPFAEKATPENNGWLDFGENYYYNGPDDRQKLSDEITADYLIDVLQREHAQPFFACFGVCRPHTPNVVPDEYFDMYPLDELEMVPIKKNDLDDCCSSLHGEDCDLSTGNWCRVRHDLFKNGEADGVKKWVRAYLASVTYADAQVGKVLDALQNSAYAENTMVIVTADHGYHLGEKDILFKNTLWEESTRIPFILAGPGIQAGHPSDQPVSNIDLFPTIIDYCNLSDHPHGEVAKLDGRSLRPYLQNPKIGDKYDHSIVVTAVGSKAVLDTQYASETSKQHWAARSRRFRYIMAANGEEELYDRQQDPYEWNNIAGDENYDALKQDLRRRLREAIGLPVEA